VSPNEARGSVKLGTMRYVLGISTVVAIVVLVIAYFAVR
jgi:preprotein translocase subunit Sec61beta